MSFSEAIEPTPCKPSCEVTRLRARLAMLEAYVGYLLALRDSRSVALSAQTVAAIKAGKGIPFTEHPSGDGSLSLVVEFK